MILTFCLKQGKCVQVVGGGAGAKPQRSAHHLWEGAGAARAQQWEGEESGVQRAQLDCAQRTGGHGLQGAAVHLALHTTVHYEGGLVWRLPDRRSEARPEGVRMDSLQKQGGVGSQHKVTIHYTDYEDWERLNSSFWNSFPVRKF